MTRQEQCVALAGKLPEFFTSSGIAQMVEDLKTDELDVVERDGKVVGFVSFRDAGGAREITWLAVDPEHQRQGIASGLVRGVETGARAAGIREIVVKTLADDMYEPYRATRAFYENNGYTLAEIIDPYPDWDPGNPCGIYRKSL